MSVRLRVASRLWWWWVVRNIGTVFRNKLTARGIHKIDGLNLCGRCYTDRDRGKKVRQGTGWGGV